MRVRFERILFLLFLLFVVFSLGYVIGNLGQTDTFSIRPDRIGLDDDAYTAVPSPGAESPSPDTLPGTAPNTSPDVIPAWVPIREDTRLNINTATAEELMDLPGIGPVTAERIVTHRAENGPFASISEITNVYGIGPATLEKIRAYIQVDSE